MAGTGETQIRIQLKKLKKHIQIQIQIQIQMWMGWVALWCIAGDRRTCFCRLFCRKHKVSLITMSRAEPPCAILARVWLITDPTQRDDQISSLTIFLILPTTKKTIKFLSVNEWHKISNREWPTMCNTRARQIVANYWSFTTGWPDFICLVEVTMQFI